MRNILIILSILSLVIYISSFFLKKSTIRIILRTGTLIFLFFSIFYFTIEPYNSVLRTVQIDLQTHTTPPSITMNWGGITPGAKYVIFKKVSQSDSWGAPIAEISGLENGYIDTNVEVSKAYEYKILKKRILFEGTNFLYSGIKIPPSVSNKTILLLIDTVYQHPLSDELKTFKYDLIGDNWNVITKYVPVNTNQYTLKKIIKDSYSKDTKLSTVLIIGHLAVAYSGNYAYDSHPNHTGAWPSDIYYGDLHGIWTDSIVNNTRAKFSDNHNIPGDHKFDKSFLEDTIDLVVARIDFTNLPVLNKDHVQLTKEYFIKNHSYRSGKVEVTRKGFIENEFKSILKKRSYAATGWRSFNAMFGKNKIDQGSYTKQCTDSSYLFTFICGSGSPTTIGDIVKSEDYVNNSFHAIFNIVHGSYFGDWNTQNNILRTSVASKSDILVSIWAGHPPFFFHHMALGYHIGYSFRISVNNDGMYSNHKKQKGIHMSLHGDPTLRLHVVKPVSHIEFEKYNDGIELKWDKPNDEIIGYNIYRSNNIDSSFVKLNESVVKNEIYTDTLPLASENIYMIRAVKLETSGSGTYFNQSQGTFIEIKK